MLESAVTAIRQSVDDFAALRLSIVNARFAFRNIRELIQYEHDARAKM